jgi:hypothetical protein
MKGWSRRRALALAAVAAVGVVAVGGTALAGLAGSVKTFTGCLAANDGVIVKVKEGNTPKTACSSGQTLVRLSGGDITKISVTGGLTLPDGPGTGESGDVTIGLDTKYTLPQSCADSDVAKWDSATSAWLCAVDDDTTYSNGTGLDLTGTTFSIDGDYRVKNTPDCSSGQFATGFSSSGAIQCAAPPAATLQAFSAPQSDYEDGVGIPDDGAFHVIASVSVPAGNYFITAKGLITSAGNVDDFSSTECQLQSGAIVYDSMRWGSVTIDDNSRTTLALAGLGHSDGGTIQLACSADDGADGVGMEDGRLVVLKVG